MLLLKQNPYTWDDSSEDISTPVIQFELKTGKGSRMNISDLEKPFELFLPITEQLESANDDSKDQLFVKPDSTLRYHEVHIDSSDKTVFVKLQPQNYSAFDVFVSSGMRPTEKNHNFSARIPDFSSCSTANNQVGHLNCTSDPFVFAFSSALTGQTGLHFIGVRLANSTASASKANMNLHERETRSCGESAGRQKRSCVRVKDAPTILPPTELVMPKFNATTDVTYTMLVTSPSCVYWSETKQTWTTEGCKVRHTKTIQI